MILARGEPETLTAEDRKWLAALEEYYRPAGEHPLATDGGQLDLDDEPPRRTGDSGTA
jgi:hypothetical protein